MQGGDPLEIIVVSHWFSMCRLTYALVESSFFAKAWRMLSRQKWAKWRQRWELVGVNSWCINCSIQPPQTKNLSIWRVGAQQVILVHQSWDVTMTIFPSKLQLRSLENLNFLMSFRCLLYKWLPFSENKKARNQCPEYLPVGKWAWGLDLVDFAPGHQANGWPQCVTLSNWRRAQVLAFKNLNRRLQLQRQAICEIVPGWWNEPDKRFFL